MMRILKYTVTILLASMLFIVYKAQSIPVKPYKIDVQEYPGPENILDTNPILYKIF